MKIHVASGCHFKIVVEEYLYSNLGYWGIPTYIYYLYPTYDVDQSAASVYKHGIVLWLGKS